MDTRNAFLIVISGHGDSAALEKSVGALVKKSDGDVTAEYRDVGGPNPQVRKLDGKEREVPTLKDRKDNLHGEGYAAAAPPVLKITGLEQSPGSLGPLSPAPSTMAANDGVDDDGGEEKATKVNADGSSVDDDDEAALDKEHFQSLGASNIGDHLSGTEDKTEIRRWQRWEKAHPKHEGGRKGVLSAIEARLAELE